MTDYVEWAAYVGPHYLDYDWTVHQFGNADYLGMTAVLANVVSDGDTVVTVDGATGFANTGGVWVQANGVNQGTEYVSYSAKTSGSFTGIVREPSTERYHNGVHSIGAVVRPFIRIAGDNGTFQIDSEVDDATKSVLTWTATISGKRYQQILRNGHVVIVQRRTDPLGPLVNCLVGFIDRPEVVDDANRHGEWTLPIVSIAGLLANTRSSAVRSGSFNLGSSGTASASSTLVDPLAELGNGDYTAAAPELAASSATDDLIDTLWVGDIFHGTSNAPATNSDPKNNHSLRFSQIYVNPPPGSLPGSRWFEMTMVAGGNIQGMTIHAANGGSGTIDWLFGGPGSIGAGARLIFCEDEDVFTALHPTSEHVALYEFSAFFDQLLPSGGELWLRLGELNMWLSLTRWGDGNGYINHEDAPDQDWTGPAVTAPAYGETMRYIFTPSSPSVAADYWVTDRVYHPGYELDATSTSWFMLELPGIGLVLDGDITATVPGVGELLRIVDGAANPNTGGLDASGVLQIASEQISYSSKGDGGVIVSARGYGGTTAAIHDAGDVVYVVDGGIATDAPPISLVTLRWGGTIKAKDYLIYTSKFPTSVRSPDTGGWEADWEGLNTVTGNSAATQNNFIDPSRRIKHIVVIISAMTTNPARARLSELEVYLDESKYGNEGALPSDSTVGEIVQQILVNAGFPSTAVVHSGTPALDKVQTAADFVWAVIADFADFAGVKIVVQRDSRIGVYSQPLWTAAQTPIFTWDRSNARQIKKTWNNGANVSQVVIRWRSSDGNTNGVARYPATAGLAGSPVELEGLVYANGTAAATAAQRRYFALRYPSSLLVDCANEHWAMFPSVIHDYSWQFNEGEPEMGAVCVVARTHHRFEKRVITSAVELTEIQHVSNY